MLRDLLRLNKKRVFVINETNREVENELETLYSTPMMDVEKGSQEKMLEQEPECHDGLCQGLTTLTVMKNLSSNSSYNPFADSDLDTSMLCKGQKAANIKPEHSVEESLKRMNEMNQLPAFDLTPTKTLPDYKLLNPELEKMVNQTATDGVGRGTWIGSIFDSEYLDHDGSIEKGDLLGHSLAMTVKKLQDNHLQCIGIEPNKFFVKGHGVEGCNKVIKTMSRANQYYKPVKTEIVQISVPPANQNKL